jgi:hypothetical protein
MIITIQQLEHVLSGQLHGTDEAAAIFHRLVKNELKRRSKAGRRPESGLSRQEQNRLAQKKRRSKRRYEEARAREEARREEQR